MPFELAYTLKTNPRIVSPEPTSSRCGRLPTSPSCAEQPGLTKAPLRKFASSYPARGQAQLIPHPDRSARPRSSGDTNHEMIRCRVRLPACGRLSRCSFVIVEVVWVVQDRLAAWVRVSVAAGCCWVVPLLGWGVVRSRCRCGWWRGGSQTYLWPSDGWFVSAT